VKNQVRRLKKKAADKTKELVPRRAIGSGNVADCRLAKERYKKRLWKRKLTR